MSGLEAKSQKKRKDNKVDLMFKDSKMDKFFKVTDRGSNFTTEFRAGCTTYLTAAYIMAVNPNILSVTGLNFEGLVFATAMSSFIATLIMALWANLPFGLWPGMGMNAYFAYTVVGFKGTQHYVKKVMFAVMIEGIVFMVMSALDLRRPILKIFPTWLMKATMAGIGLFLSFIGLQAGNGIDLVRAHPAILVDIISFTGEHQARTFLGIFFFFLMGTLVMLRVRGAVMIGILLSTFFCWTLEAAGTKQFVYQPKCCLGNVKFDTTAKWFPATGSSYIGAEQFIPKPVCEGPAGVFEVTGTASNLYVPATAAADEKFISSWSGAKVTGNYYDWTVTDPDGTAHYVPGKALLYNGNGDGRNSLGFKGDCMDVCHSMFGGFGGVTPGVYGYGACFGSLMVDAGCWTGMTHRAFGDLDQDSLKATGTIGIAATAPSYTIVDGFGEGCLGGAGRIPKTFAAPSAIVAAPKAAMAGDIVPPYPGWFGCDGNGTNCFAGDIAGGTAFAFDTEGLSFANFGIPLIILLYVDFLGTLGFLYAAADCSGLIDPANPGTFEGCYAAFWADAIGTFVGGLLGTSSVTTYGESMAGVYEGGRTGMTALWIALFNFLSMFFAPLFSSIPTVSTGPALIMVGVFMAEGLKDIDWHDYMQAIPSLLCVLLQPVTYKIEVGILAGIFCWIFMQVVSLRILLRIPGCWNATPACIKSFVSRQSLNAHEQGLLAALGGKPAGETKTVAEA